MGNVLVISCHTDDIELGAGAYVSKLTRNGYTVFGYVPTLAHVYDDAPNTANECMLSWDLLNITPVSGGNDHHAREIDRQKLLDSLIKLRDSINPSLVITHGSMDTHQSHQTVYNESLRAFKRCTIIGYNHPWNCQNGTKNNVYKEVDEVNVTDKIKALKCYESQRERTYFSTDYQYYNLRKQGMDIGVRYAECFELIRWIQ